GNTSWSRNSPSWHCSPTPGTKERQLAASWRIRCPVESMRPAEGSPSTQAETTFMDSKNYIDAHVHVWTADTAHYPLAEGFKKEDMKPASVTPEELFKHTKPNGVNRINLIQMSFYRFNNNYMQDMMALYPDIFAGTAVIDPGARGW